MRAIEDVEIAMIGAGAWGTTLAKVLAENWPNKEIMLWVRRQELKDTIERTRENPEYLPGIALPYNMRPTCSMPEAAEGRDVFIFAVPSLHALPVMRLVAEFLEEEEKKERILVNAAKGAEKYVSKNPVFNRLNKTEWDYYPLRQILLGELYRQSYKLWNSISYTTLSGPSFAREVAERMPTRVVAAGRQEKDVELVRTLFSNPYFTVEASNDVNGVELYGALKNVVAIAVGIADGLGFGDNAKVIIAIKGKEEIDRVAFACNADQDTLRGPAGLGDLMLTCMGKLSRNVELGRRVGRGEQLNEVLISMRGIAEGAHTAEAALLLARSKNIPMPVVTFVYQALYENAPPREALLELIRT